MNGNSMEKAENGELIALVREAIDAAGGVISFAEYMDLALFAPRLGYYSGGLEQFGGAGDFVTAPELSPLFARCLARQMAEIVNALGAGEGGALEVLLVVTEGQVAEPGDGGRHGGHQQHGKLGRDAGPHASPQRRGCEVLLGARHLRVRLRPLAGDGPCIAFCGEKNAMILPAPGNSLRFAASRNLLI